MTTEGAQVAVAVVSTNLRELLAPCLRSLEPEVEAGRAEVWVVDNASSDGSPDMVRQDFPWASLIASDENLGYGRAVNLVAERTGTPWLAPANEDIELAPGALQMLLDAGEEHPEAAVIAPRLVLPDGSTQHSVWAFPTVSLALAFNLGAQRLSRRLGERLCLQGYWNPDRPREVPWAIATFVLVRRSAFDAVGGFAREQWMHAEDLDLAWRLTAAGWRTRYEPRARVRHAGSASTKKAFGEDLMSRYMAATYSWMVRRRGLRIAWATAAVNFASSGVRFLLTAPLAAVRPVRWGERHEGHRYWSRLHRAGLRSRTTLLRAR